MYHPTTRVLTILELLQSHPELSSRELAERLEVDRRTIRRYVTMLQDMGIPIEADRGRNGAYYLRPGYKLPPLMFNHDEALAVALSLRLAQKTALAGAGVTLEGAVAKLERVLPDDLKQQMRDVLDSIAIEMNVVQGVETDTSIIREASRAVRLAQQIRLRHASYSGQVTERTVNPLGVAYRLGRWYMVGYCHLRDEIRTFRLDRVVNLSLLDETFAPQSIDIMAHVEQAIAQTPGVHLIEVLFEASHAQIAPHIPTALGHLTTTPDGVLLRCYVQHLPWMAGFLAGVPFVPRILQPDALREEMRQIHARLTQMLGQEDHA